MIFSAFDSVRKRRKRRQAVAEADLSPAGTATSEREAGGSPPSEKLDSKEQESVTAAEPTGASSWSGLFGKRARGVPLTRTYTDVSSISSGDFDSLASLKAHTRWLPILSGILCPFAILLEIPGLTSHWYIQTDGSNASGAIVDSQPNPAWLVTLLAISLTQGVVANVALIGRFLEWRPWGTTVTACCALTLHDCLNIVVVIYFGVIHAVDDGYTYGSPYYMAVASTVASCVCNITLLVDFFRVKEFSRHGSGLTPKQRTLVIAIMALLCYIALGALVWTQLLDLDFETSIYFNITTSRVFSYFYDPVGIIMIAFVIKVARETLLESFEKTYRKRRHAMAERARERRRLRRAQLHARKEAFERGDLTVPLQPHTSLASRAKAPDGPFARVYKSLPPWLRRADSEDQVKQLGTGDAAFTRFKDDLKKEERREARVKLGTAVSLFFAFWLLGAMLFTFTEGWNYEIALWFCFVFFSTIGYGDYTPQTPAGRAVFIAWSLFGISVLTLLIAVLTEQWSSTYASSISKSKLRSTMHLLKIDKKSATAAIGLAQERRHDPHASVEATMQENADIGQQLHQAAQDFTTHARYFMNGREGDPPARLRALLAMAEDDEGLEKLRYEMDHSVSTARGDTKQFLWMMSYERSLEHLSETAERVSSLLSSHQRELDELRSLNAALKQQLDGGDEPLPTHRPHLSVDTIDVDVLRKKVSRIDTIDLEKGLEKAEDLADEERERAEDADEEAIQRELISEEREEAGLEPPTPVIALMSQADRVLQASEGGDRLFLRPARQHSNSLVSPITPLSASSPLFAASPAGSRNVELSASKRNNKSMSRSLTWDVDDAPSRPSTPRR